MKSGNTLVLVSALLGLSLGANAVSAETVVACHGSDLIVTIVKRANNEVATVTFGATEKSYQFDVQPGPGAETEYVGVANAEDDFYLTVDGTNSEINMPELQTDEQINCH
jgi:hypothetical protein